MAPEAITKSFTFRMDTASFVSIWKNANDWHRFVQDCWDRFSVNGGNVNRLTEYDAGWGSWSQEEQYNALSDRCYSKCIAIRSSVKKATGRDMDLPKGYKERNGSKTSRISASEIATLFFDE